MKRNKRKVASLAAVLLPLAALLALALAAAGQEIGPGSAGPTGADESLSVLVPAADFVDDGLTAFDFAYHDAGGYTYVVTDTFACMQAPLYLPNGATVTSFGGYVYDDDPAGRIDALELRRVRYLAGLASNSELMAKASTTTGYAASEVTFAADESVELGQVDTGQFLYYAMVCMNGGPGDILRLYAVEATYSQ